MNAVRWIALFSKSGAELNTVSERLGRYPDLIVTNRNTLDGVDKTLARKGVFRAMPRAPDVRDYMDAFGAAPTGTQLITMHGFMRIVPARICDRHTIWNMHPGWVTRYPQLKGRDPQQRALELGLPSTGVTLHRATAELDGGPIVMERACRIAPGTTLDALCAALTAMSVDLWVEFISSQLNG